MKLSPMKATFLFGIPWIFAVLSLNGALADSIKIALANPLTGPAAAMGISAKAGMELAMEEINAAGGILGKKLELQAEDDKGDPREAASVARKLVSDKNVLAVVGHLNSSCTLAGAPIYNRGKLVELSYGSTNPSITHAGPWTFRNCVTDTFQGDFVAKYSVETLKLKTFAILFDNDDYGRGLMEAFRVAVQKYKGKVIAVEAYARGQSTDFTAQLTKIKSINPDALFIAGIVNEGALIASQARRVGLHVPLLGADGIFSEDLVKLGGTAVEGIRFSGFFHYTSKSKVAQQFVKAYRKRFGKIRGLPSDPDAWSAQAYDCVYLLKIAMEGGGFTRAAIREELEKIGSIQPAYDGVTGKHVFDKNGDMDKPLLMLTVRKGSITTL